MTTFATGNPVGSKAVKDLSDNAENLDLLLLGPAEYYPDRLGVNRRSWRGIENTFELFLENSGFSYVGNYSAGLVVTSRSQYFIRETVAYRIKDSASLPYTLTGTWALDQPNFVAFDSAIPLAQNLSSFDPMKGVTLVRGAPRTVGSLDDLRALPKTGTPVVFVKAVGRYDLDEADTTSPDTGGSVIVATDGGRWKLSLLSTIDVRQFGAICDGVVDDTVAVQKWLNFLQLTGLIGVGAGVCKTSSTLATVSPFSIKGSFGGFALRGSFATGDILAIGSIPGTIQGGADITGIEVSSSVTRTAGYNINLIGAYNTRLDKILVRNGFNHVGITGAASQSTHLNNFRSENAKNYHFAMLNVSADVTLDNWYCNGQGALNQSVAGAYIRQAGDVTLSRFNTAYCGSDVVIAPQSGERVQALHISNSYLDTASGYGVYAVPEGTGRVDLLSLTNNWICTHDQGGVLLGGGSGTIQQADLVNNVVSNNLLNGVFLNIGANNVSIIGGSCSANANSGIAVAPDVSKFKILGVTSGPSGEFGANGQWGIVINNGAGQDFIVSSNNLEGNPLGGLYDGATGPYRQTGGNIPDSGAFKSYAKPATDWDFDGASKGATPIPGGGTLILPSGGGLVMLVDDADGACGLYMVSGGLVRKIIGEANFVSGPAAANQIGLSYSAGNYRVGNGYPGTKNIYITSLKGKISS